MLKPDKDKVKNNDPLGILSGNGNVSEKTNDPLGILKKKDLTTPLSPSSQPLETGGMNVQNLGVSTPEIQSIATPTPQEVEAGAQQFDELMAAEQVDNPAFSPLNFEQSEVNPNVPVRTNTLTETYLSEPTQVLSALSSRWDEQNERKRAERQAIFDESFVIEDQDERQRQDRQAAFEATFEVLEEDDPLYIEQKNKEENIRSITNQIGTSLVGRSEEEVVPALQEIILSVDEKYQLFEFEESGAGRDELVVRNKFTGDNIKISLDNWTDERDRSEAMLLSGFIELNAEFPEYSIISSEIDLLRQNTSMSDFEKNIQLYDLYKEKRKLKAQMRNYASNDKYLSAAYSKLNEAASIDYDISSINLQKQKLQSATDEYRKGVEFLKSGQYDKMSDQQKAEAIQGIQLSTDQLQQDLKDYEEANVELQDKQEDLNEIAGGAYLVQEERGNVASGVLKSFTDGLASPIAFIGRAAGDKEISSEDIADDLFYDGIVTEEYMSSSDRNMLEQALFGVSESVGAALGGAALMPVAPSPGQFMGLYSMSYMDAKDEMNSPDFDDVSEGEKVLFSSIYGATVGMLDRFGLSKSISKTPAGKAALNWVFKDAIKNVPKNATIDVFEKELKSSTRKALTKGLFNVGSGALAEGGTETLQEVADIGLKEIYNLTKEKDMFQTPESLDEAWERVSKAFVLGTIGGGAMNGASQLMRTGKNQWDKATIKSIEKTVMNPGISEAFKKSIESRIATNEITQEEGDQILSSMEEAREMFESIPDAINNESRYDAFSLIAEKKEIENQIQGKERSLVGAESKRLTQINQELKQIGDKATREKLVETLEEDLKVEKESEFGGNQETIQDLESQISSLKEVDIDTKEQVSEEQGIEETTISVPISENIEINTVEDAETEYKIDDGFYNESEFIEKLNDPDFMSQVKNGEVLVQVQNPSAAVEGLILTEKTVQNEVQQTQETQNQAQDTEVDPVTQQTQSDLGFEPQGATIAPISGQNSRQKKFVLQAEAETATQAVKQMILSGIRLDKAVMKKELGLTDSEMDSKKGLFTSTKPGGAKTVSVDGMIEVLKSSNPSFFERMDDSDIRQMIIDVINDNNSTSEIQKSLTEDFTVDGVIYEKINDRSGAQNFSQEQKQVQEIEGEALVQERIIMEAEIAEMSEEDIDSAEKEFDNYIESLTDEEIEEQFGDYGSKIGTEKSIEGEKGTAVDAEQKDQKGARKVEEKESKNTQTEDSEPIMEGPEKISKMTRRAIEKSDAPSRERSFATRVLQSEDVSQEVKEGLSEDAKRYIPVSNEITVGEANAIIEAKGVEQATKDVLNSKNKMEPRVRVAMALELVKKNNEINTPESLEAATEIANEMSRYATELGQAVQIYSIWSRITSDGMLISYDKNQDDVRRKIKDQNPEFYQGSKSGYRSGNKKAGKKAAKKVFGKETPKVKKAKAFNLSKEEISAKKKEALARLKKATKGGPLTSGGINVEALEALTDYGFYVFADGVRTFKEWSREMRKATDLKDDDVLRDIWLNKKTDSGKTLEELSQLDSIEDIASEFLSESSDVSALSQALQDTFDLDQDLADGLAQELVSEFDKSAARIRKSEIEKKTTGRSSKKVRKAIDEISKSDNLDSEGIENVIEEAFGVKSLTEEQRQEIKELGEERDKRPEGFLKDEITREMMSKIEKFGGIPKGDIIWSLWYSGVLSGWETQAVNIGANALNIGMESFVSMIEQSVINRDPQAFASGVSGLMKGMRQGYDEFNEVLKEGFSPARVTQKLEVKDTLENVDFWGGKLNPYNYYKYVGRFMTAVDTASYMAAQGMRKQELAREINRKDGFRGEELAKKVSEDLNNDKEAYNEAFAQATEEVNEVSERANYSRKQKNRLIRIRANEIVSDKVSEEIKTKAENFASFATFNYEPVGVLGTIAKALSALGSKLPLFKLIVPFTRVVANVLNQQLDYTPYGYLRALGLNASARMDASTKASTVRERNRKLIKATIGLIGIWALSELSEMYEDDEDPWFQITGKGPTNFNKKNQLYSQGWKPYSVKIGDTWISYQYTQLGLGLSWIGNWKDAEKYDDLSESSNAGKMGYAMQSSIQGVFDMSFLTGLGSFFDALSTSGDPEKTKDKLLKTFGRTASSFIVPNFIKQVDRIYDPTLYDKTDVSSAILADIPIVNRMSNLKPKLNAFGQSVERTGNRFTTPENQDKIWKFMAKHRVFAPGASPSTKMLDGVVMTQQEFYDYIEISGGIAYDIFSENLDDLDSDFSELENAERQKIVNKVFSMARKRAKGEVYEKYRD